MSKHIVIIGAGPGGLATAMRLAGQGYSVEIFEAADRVGGRMRGFENGAYAFDTGPTILQVPRIYDELFAESGLRRTDYIHFKQLEPFMSIRFWDGTQLDLTSKLDAFKVKLANIRPDLPAAFDRWYAEHVRKNEAGYKPYLGSPVRSVLGYLRPDELATALLFRPWESLYQQFWRFFKDERLVYAFSYSSKYLGMHPTVSASVFSLIPFLEFADGVWHPEGGFRALAQALGKAADSSTLQMTTKTGLQIVVQYKVPRETISHSKDVRVSIRPEKIRLSLSPPESKMNCFEGRLQHVMYLGTHIHYVVELLSGDRLTVRLPNVTNKLPDPNTPVYARWAATDCLALEE